VREPEINKKRREDKRETEHGRKKRERLKRAETRVDENLLDTLSSEISLLAMGEEL
jgi:hypothetical protein